jgi:hypothetical protein
MRLRRSILFVALSLFAACAEEEAACTQAAVDACFANEGCDGNGTCSLDVVGMNSLCACLSALDCEQSWYHAYCDDAPYPEDGGCPICGE